MWNDLPNSSITSKFVGNARIGCPLKNHENAWNKRWYQAILMYIDYQWKIPDEWHKSIPAWIICIKSNIDKKNHWEFLHQSNTRWVTYQKVQLPTFLSHLLNQSFTTFTATAICLDVNSARQSGCQCFPFLNRWTASGWMAWDGLGWFGMACLDVTFGSFATASDQGCACHLAKVFGKWIVGAPTVDDHLITFTGKSLSNRLALASQHHNMPSSWMTPTSQRH